MTWYFDNKSLITDSIDTTIIGFVYKITNLISNRSYIGQKKFWVKAKTKKAKLAKIKFVPSDWQSYWGSNLELQNDVAHCGEINFRREIISLCHSKSEMNYVELYHQMINNALLHPDLYYNSYAGGRISRKHLKKYIEKLKK